MCWCCRGEHFHAVVLDADNTLVAASIVLISVLVEQPMHYWFPDTRDLHLNKPALWFSIRRPRCLSSRPLSTWPLVIIINRGSRVVKSNRTLPFTSLNEDDACASIALPFCLRLASLLMSGKTTINGAIPVCWRKSSALCAISSASGTVPVTSVKSVFIIGINGLAGCCQRQEYQ